MNSVNAFIRSTIDDLVEKRLWPVAAVLLIALIAIPVLLSNPADEQPAPASTAVAPAVGAGDALSAFQPAVNTEGKKSSEIRKDLEGFETKDPFKPQNVGGGGAAARAARSRSRAATPRPAAVSTDPSIADAPPLGTSGGGAAGGGSSTDTSGTPTKTQTFYYTYAADVRFGKEGNLDRKTLSQFRSLPSSEDPVVVFMGVQARTARQRSSCSPRPRRRPARATASPTTPAPSST